MWIHVFLTQLIGSAFAGFTLKWVDEFDSVDNWDKSDLDGWNTGNNEWEYYTSREENIFIRNIDGDNALVLHAQKEEYKGYNVTSGKVISKEEFGPGVFMNFRAKVPKGTGLWPAIFLLPNEGISKYGTWAACGEIDILETICDDPTAYATLQFGKEFPFNSEYPEDNKYHVDIDWTKPHNFGLHWELDQMTFYYDAEVVNGEIQGTVISSISSEHWFAQSNGTYYPPPAPFDEKFKIILNVAVGGYWPCNTCCSGGVDSFALPAEMEIFYVRVYENLQENAIDYK